MKRQQGFTLIEIILVVFIIGMAISVISLTVGGDDPAQSTRKEADEFMLRASYIAEQSVLKGESHGLFLEPKRAEDINAGDQWCLKWQRVRDRQWQDLPELEQRCLPEGMVIEFVIDGKRWEFDPELEYQDPVMGFYPSGDGSGEVEIGIYIDGKTASEDDVQRIELHVMGDLHWINEEKRLAANKER